MKRLSRVEIKGTNYQGSEYVELENFGSISVKECKKIANENSDYGIISKIEIDLSEYEEYEKNGKIKEVTEEFLSPRVGKEKTAIYYPNANSLKIYEFDTLIYGNLNGKIIYSEEE